MPIISVRHKPAGNSTSLVPRFIAGKRNTKKKHDLDRERPVAYRHPGRTTPDVVGKILEIRAEYQLEALRIMYYLERYHAIKISESTVTRVLRAHGIRRLPKTAPRPGMLFIPNGMQKRFPDTMCRSM
jgi:hypothetical protein